MVSRMRANFERLGSKDVSLCWPAFFFVFSICSFWRFDSLPSGSHSPKSQNKQMKISCLEL